MMVIRGIAAFCFYLVMITGAQAAKRVALVIGNSEYQHVSALPNPVNDATDIAASFTRLGFDVTLLDNLGFSGTRQALGEFSEKAFGADMAVIFYAGHGMEVNKRNYLIPTDAELATDRAISYEAVPMDLLTEAVSGAKGLKLIMLDACRNNPFAAEMTMTSSTRSIGRGLAKVEPADGTLISFAAKEGTVAIDGEGRNSPYTKALLEHLEQAELEIQFLFRKVRDQVMAETGNHQQPFTYGSLPGTAIYLFQNPVTANITINQTKPENDVVTKLEQRLEELQRRLDEAENRFSNNSSDTQQEQQIAAKTDPGSTDIDQEKPQQSLDDLFNKGQDVYDRRQYVKALRTWRVAAVQGHTKSQSSLGHMYENGYGVNKDLAEAANWYRKAAEQGLARAQNNLGYMYREGSGIEQNNAVAVSWFRKAAEQGFAPGQNSLGYMFGNGYGVEQDYSEAVNWYRKAAEQRNSAANHNLGLYYDRGYGIEKNPKTAAQYVLKAIKAGNQYSIGQIKNNSRTWSKTFRVELQRLLKEAGYYKGALDGAFGSATKAAIDGYAKTGSNG